MSEITATSDIMAGEPILPDELWLISCDGRASFKWSLIMVESYLPNIRTNFARVSPGFGLFFQSSAGGAIGIMLDGVSSDVLTKIDEYMRFFIRRRNLRFYDNWLIDFLSNLDADMMKKLKSETEKRCVQLEAAGTGPPDGRDSAMQLLADLTANLCSVCIDQQTPQVRATRSDGYNQLLRRVVQKMIVERRNERGYFGNV